MNTPFKRRSARTYVPARTRQGFKTRPVIYGDKFLQLRAENARRFANAVLHVNGSDQNASLST
jgi:hypothetical protein